MSNIQLRNIRSLSGLSFFIPDYQRGYRWGKREADQMLNDFKVFCERKKNEGEFYCLQPIVVRKRSWQDGGKNVDGYEVIDGQQRLTTLYILLKCVEDVKRILYRNFDLYSIKYETRLQFDSQRFLVNIDKSSEEEANKFIDFHYMKAAYNAMVEWLKDKDDFRNDIVNALLRQKNDDGAGDKANNIRVIWYEVSDEKTTSVDIFTRLNIGKIPLTNAELIKALFLRRGNFSDTEASLKQLQISAEWNQIEQKLQDDSFWYFLCRTSWPFKYDNRIEFLFDLMANRKSDVDPYYAYFNFSKRFTKASIDNVWLEVKAVFQIFEEWYNDRTLYHYIGFLIEYGTNINELREKSREMKKLLFEDFIGGKLRESLEDIDLSTLKYGNKDVKKVLLLFNILTILKSDKSDMRFPFSNYKKGKWDIEHICSQTDKQIGNDSQRREWLRDQCEFFVGKSERDAVSDFLKNEENNAQEREIVKSLLDLFPKTEGDKIDDNNFDEAFKLVQKYCGEDVIKDKDSLGNLTLLDAQTNRAYGNAFFPIKRWWIVSNDSQGIFVPIATKNVFLKYYTRKSRDIMKWSEVDAEDYFNAIQDTLKPYLP